MSKNQFEYDEISELSNEEIDSLVSEKTGIQNACSGSNALQFISSKRLDVRWDWDEIGKVTVLESEPDDACNSKPTYASVHKNIQRAICEVVLMME